MCVLVFGLGFCQKISFTDTSNYWTYFETDCGTGYLTYDSSNYNYYTGDTAIGAFNYHKLYSHWHFVTGTSYVREDTVSKKVYIIPYNLLSSVATALVDTEVLLYNYNWVVGDSIKYNFPGISKSIAFVAQADSIQINGIWHKHWLFVGVDSVLESFVYGDSIHYDVIEGIGCLNDIYYSLEPLPISSSICGLFGSTSDELKCFSTRGTIPEMGSIFSTHGVEYNRQFDNLGCYPAGVSKQVREGGTVRVSPNPLTNESKIVFPHVINRGRICVYNYLGQVVFRSGLINTSEQDIGMILSQSGAYCYSLVDDENGNTYRGTMVR